MDFTNPMVLANAMIFHDSMTQQMNQQMNSFYTPSYIPPTPYDSYHPPHIPINPLHYQYKIEVVEEVLESPITLEDSLAGTVYFKAVLGVLEEEKTVVASVILDNPKPSQIGSIEMILSEKIALSVPLETECIVMVVSGEYSEEFKRILLKNLRGKVTEYDDKLMIEIIK